MDLLCVFSISFSVDKDEKEKKKTWLYGDDENYTIANKNFHI